MKQSAKQTNGMSQESYEAIKWALTKGKLIADTETGIVINARSNKTGWTEVKGYLRIGFQKEGKSYQPFVHQVVAIAGGLNPVGLTINHRDGDKLNNSISNLEAITNRENLAHAISSGLLATKLTESNVKEIKRLLAEGAKQKDLAELFNVSNQAISNINKGKTWTHVTLQESFFNADKEAEYLHLEELYNNSTDDAKRKALKRALYEMEIS